MTPLELAEEIINGRRITRQDDLTFFLSCDLDELCVGADRIRKHFVGDKVDLCSIINGRSGCCVRLFLAYAGNAPEFFKIGRASCRERV